MHPAPRPLLCRLLATLLAAAPGALAAAPGYSPDVGRLEQQLAAAAPAERSPLLARLARALEPVDLPRALAAAERARALATEEGQELTALVELASVHRRRGDYTTAHSLAQEGRARARDRGDERLEAEFLFLLGRTCWSRGQYPESVECYLQQLGLAEKLHDERLLALGHAGLGSTYLRLGQREEAGRRHARALDHARRCGDPSALTFVLNLYGNYHMAGKSYDRAAELYEESLRLRRSLGHDRGVADTLTNLANVAQAAGDLEGALAQHREALAIYERVGVPRNLALAHSRIASLLRQLRRADESLAHLRTGLALAEKLGSQTVLASFHRELSLTHEARGELLPALQSERALATANAAVLNERAQDRIAELQARYDAEKRDREIERLQRERTLQADELRRRRRENAAIAAGLLLAVGLGGAVAFAQRQRLRAERRALAATEEARQAAVDAAQLKTRLLQIASHDLQAPIALVRTAAASIRQEADGNPAVNRLADAIYADSLRMSGLVHEFLDRAALEAGRLELHLETVDLATLARETAEGFAGLAAGKRQILEFTAPVGAPLRVRADAARLRQIIENLLSNALKFSPAGGLIAVSVEPAGDRVLLAVRDSGPGLAPEDFARLYAPFGQLSAAPTAGEPTHGLGLSIAHELLANQRGTLEVESQPGEGATFRIVLPAAD